MSKIFLMNYLENVCKLQEAEQVIYKEVKEVILAHLRKSNGGWVRYLDLCEEIYKEELVAQDIYGKLKVLFQRNFEDAIDRLHVEKIVYRSWRINMGGMVIFLCEGVKKDIV